MSNAKDGLVIETVDQIHRILHDDDPLMVQRLLYSIDQFPDSGFAEMVCESLEEHIDTDVRLAVAHAYAHLAGSGSLMFDESGRPFFDAELERIADGEYSTVQEKELLQSYQIVALANDWEYDHDLLEKAGVLFGCGAATSWAYVASEINTQSLSASTLHNLAKKDWSYSKSEPCGKSIDNIDGMITFYCCPDCQARVSS